MPVLQIVIAVLLPGLGAALLLLLVAVRSRGTRGRWAGGLCLSGALISSYFIMDGWPGWTPAAWRGRIEAWERWEWIVAIVAGGGLLSMLNGLIAHRTAPWLLVPLAGAGAAMLVRPTAAFEPSWLWRAGLAAAIVVLYPCMAIAARRPGPAAPAALAIWLTAASLVLMKVSAFATLSFLAAAPAACCGIAAAGSGLFARNLSIARGATLAAALILPLLLLVGWFYDLERLRPAAYLLAALGPLALLAGLAPPVRRLRPLPAALVRAVLVIIPAAAAIAIALGP